VAGKVWELKVFQRAYRLSLGLHRASLGWPKVEQYGGVADQVRRASKSVCAMLIEGAGRQTESDVEFRRYVTMALASAEEARLWCRYAEDLGFAEADAAAAWQDELGEIARMLQGLRTSLSDH
jgi:four helix bundle protein